MAKKLDGLEAALFKKIINRKSKTVIDVEGELFVIQLIKEDSILADIQNDYEGELKKMFERADEDILRGRLYSSDELLEAIERGEI